MTKRAAFTSYTTEQPTMNLRFNGGRLQQMMVVRRYDNGAAISSAEEWRDVPDVTRAEAGAGDRAPAQEEGE